MLNAQIREIIEEAQASSFARKTIQGTEVNLQLGEKTYQLTWLQGQAHVFGPFVNEVGPSVAFWNALGRSNPVPEAVTRLWGESTPTIIPFPAEECGEEE